MKLANVDLLGDFMHGGLASVAARSFSETRN
jgi:hypothetical protein